MLSTPSAVTKIKECSFIQGVVDPGGFVPDPDSAVKNKPDPTFKKNGSDFKLN